MTNVTISRYWNNPEISTSIDSDQITLSISMEDFTKALKSEIGSVATTFTQKSFEKKLDEAINSVLEKVKEESIKIMAEKG